MVTRARGSDARRRARYAGPNAGSRLAVELAALRDHAIAHQGVAADHDVFPRPGRARDRSRRASSSVLRVESIAIAHLSLRGSLRAAIVLARRRTDPFDVVRLAVLRAG